MSYIDCVMHHNTKRQKSPTRHKPSNIVRPLVISKSPTVQNMPSTKTQNLGQSINTNTASQIKIQSVVPANDTGKQESAKFNPHDFIKQNGIRNTYDICMIKKFIGKKILVPAKGLLLTPKVKEDAKNIKAALLLPSEGSHKIPKNIIMHIICAQGTMMVINGYSNYLAISSISYKDIDANNALKQTEIKLIQLPKISNSELRILLDYFA